MYDIIILGAGPGGYEAALRAAQLGAKTALVEKGEIGGTCLNRGCVPTKALLHAAELYRQAQDGTRFGVCAENLRVDLAAMYARKDEVVSRLRGGVEGLLKRAKVDILRGTGTILAPGKVQVSGDEVAEYACRYILTATGASPARPPIPGLSLAVSSDELLAGLPKLPGRLVIIGGGVIGAEFATFFADLGTEVTILEGLDRLLPNMDRELGQSLAASFKKRGVRVHTGAMVQRLTQTDTGISVAYAKTSPASGRGGGPLAVEGSAPDEQCVGDVVLCAIGRTPDWAGLFAEGLQPRTEGRRLWADDNFETSIPGVYAIGDLSSPVQLAHVATAQGRACVERLFGAAQTTRLDLIPGCVYTRPEIASVGLTEAAAKEQGITVKTAKALMGGNARTVILDGDRGFVKLVADADSGTLLGAQLLCERATDLIAELTTAIANGLTATQLLASMRPHPTFTEALQGALENLASSPPASHP